MTKLCSTVTTFDVIKRLFKSKILKSLTQSTVPAIIPTYKTTKSSFLWSVGL